MKKLQHISELIGKYQSGTATPEEQALLNQWYHSFDDSEATLEEGSAQQIADRIRNRLLVTIEQEHAKKKPQVDDARRRRHLIITSR